MSRQTFCQFREQVEFAGLAARDCGNEHWQIIGGVKPVNFYPRTKLGPCIYISGGHKGIHGKHATPEAAIRFAKDGICRPQTKVSRDKLSNARRRKIKWRLWGRSHECHWCHAVIESFGESRLDHIVPLDQGGSHYEDNLCQSCAACDSKRGNRAINPQPLMEAAPFDSSEEAIDQPNWIGEQRLATTIGAAL